MDFFTHLMFGFLISSWLSGNFYNPYVVLGSFLSILPDFDILLFPLWRKFPFTGHHGITHTMLFAFLAPIPTAILAKIFLWPELNLAQSIPIMLLTALVHLASDALTNWGTPLFYPFSKKYYSLAIDVAVNVYLMLSFFGFVLFLALVRFRYIAFINMEIASVIVGLIYLAYFLFRAGAKIWLRRKAKDFALLPTQRPWHWRMAKRVENEKEILVIVKNSEGIKECRIPKSVPERLRMEKAEDLVLTYYLPEVAMHLALFRFPYYEISKNGNFWQIKWYVAEMPGMNLKVEARDGQYKVESWW